MNVRETRILSDLLAHLQADRTDLMRRMDEVDEQSAVVAGLLHQAIEAHKAEIEEKDETDLAPEELEGVFRAMGKDFMGFWSETHKDRTDEKEDDDDDQD